jgi:hypothetical protein
MVFNATAKMTEFFRAVYGEQLSGLLAVSSFPVLRPPIRLLRVGLLYLALLGPVAVLSQVAVRANQLAHTWAQ